MKARSVAVAALATCGASWLIAYIRGARLRAAPRVPLEAALAQAKTGDLVVFKSVYGSGAFDIPTRMITPVTHVGMVVKNRGVTSIVETHAAGDTRRLGVYSSGVHTYPLDQRVRAYEGDVFICQMTAQLDSRGEHALRAALTELSTVAFEADQRGHYVKHCLVNRRPPSGTPRDKMFCSEFLALALVRAGLLPPDTNTECMTPSALLDVRVNDYPLFTNLVRIK